MNASIKNILIISHHYPPHITGVGRVAHNQAKHLIKLGYKVTVVTSNTSSNEKSSTIEGVEVVRIRALNVFEKLDAPFPIFHPKIIPILFRLIKDADIIHIHDAFYMSSFFAAICGKLCKKPIVLTQHVSFVAHPSRLVMLIEKIVYATTGAYIFKASSMIMTYNDRVENFLLARGVEPAKLKRLTNGVDFDLFYPAQNDEKKNIRSRFGLSLDKKIVLFVGRLVPKKGFSKVMACSSPGYQIVFAGGDAIAKSTSEVVFLGKRSQEEIAELYRASDIFLLPSESEGFPLSIQEAMACGLPIITASDEGYAGYNLDKERFVMIDNPTDTAVREALQSVINDESMLLRMAKYSEEYARNNFNWILSAGELAQIYARASEKSRVSKKIAIVTDSIYYFNKGGKEKRMYDISQRIASEGHDITVYCMKWWEGGDTFVKEGITYHAISPYYPLYYNERRSIRQGVYFALNCLRLVNKKFDVVEVDHIPHLVLFTVRAVCSLKRKKMIATWHEVWGREYWKNYLGTFKGFIAYGIERISAKLPDAIVSVSENTTRDLQSVLGIRKGIITIPNGLDFQIIKNSPVSSNASDIVFAGRLLSNKNVDVLIRAVSVLRNKGRRMKTFIIGEGPEKNNLKNLAKDAGVEDEVRFFDFFPNHVDLFSTLKASKVFVLPSSREGFGIAVIEANACGLPVVTVDEKHNASKNLIIQGENGAVSALEEHALASAIAGIWDSRISREFYEKYSEKYDWGRVFPEIQNVYLN